MAVGGYREVPGANPGGGIVPSTKNISGEEAQKREARKHAG